MQKYRVLIGEMFSKNRNHQLKNSKYRFLEKILKLIGLRFFRVHNTRLSTSIRTNKQ